MSAAGHNYMGISSKVSPIEEARRLTPFGPSSILMRADVSLTKENCLGKTTASVQASMALTRIRDRSTNPPRGVKLGLSILCPSHLERCPTMVVMAGHCASRGMYNRVTNTTPCGIYPYHQLLSQFRLRDSQLFDHYKDAQKKSMAVFFASCTFYAPRCYR